MPHISRRGFARLLGTAAVASSLPAVTQAQAQPKIAPAIPKYIRLSSNENPYGPSPAALKAIADSFPIACRYPDDSAEALQAELAKFHAVSTGNVIMGAGSGEILMLAAIAFTNENRHLVTADPTFEALGSHARRNGANVRAIPLDASYAHDVAKMREAARGAGLIYICNPNNPTATITPDKAVRELILGVSPDTMVLVDEAYHHYVTSRDYASVADLVPKRPNVILLRTFSKVFGMAGMRAGYAIAHESAIRQMQANAMWDTVNVLAAEAARASLGDTAHVEAHRKLNLETRNWLVQQMRALDLTVLPSEANFVMIDIQRSVVPVIKALREKDVYVGRLFPAMPKHLRVTVGRQEEMQRFVDAFKQVLDA